MTMRLLISMVFILLQSPALEAGDTADNAAGHRRVALVVGNGAYEELDARLKNPPNDARAIANDLRALDIEVIEAIDLDYQGMREVLRRFDRALQGADAGIFYYAGHGMEYQGQNYLFPTDSVLETEGDVGLGLIEVNQVLRVMETAVPTRLVFLDACRNNPMARKFRSTIGSSRSSLVGHGLGTLDAAVGTFIAFATAPGELASDGQGENSPFTKAMLQHIGEPGLDISHLMQRVRNSVIETTSGRQVPWESSSLRGPFVLNVDITVTGRLLTEQVQAKGVSQQAETVFWESIKDSDRLASFQAYIERFGDDGLFAPLAKARIEALKDERLRLLEAGLSFDRRKIQQALAASGYDVGGADGIFGPRTRKAIQLWQRDASEQITGYLSEKQIVVLMKQVADLPKPAETSATKSRLKEESLERTDSFAELLRDEKQNCADGDAKACFDLGLIHHRGSGVERDDAIALEMFRSACDRDHLKACANLGVHYEKGLGVDRDLGQAAAIYQDACDRKGAAACSNLGKLYRKGLGVERDDTRAVSLYESACNLGDARGCNELGVLYSNEQGVAQESEKAVMYFEKSCDLGWTSGCVNLGVSYEQGRGVERDRSRAAEIYREACSRGQARGCSSLGYLYENGIGLARDSERAIQFYREGCRGGDLRGCGKVEAFDAGNS